MPERGDSYAEALAAYRTEVLRWNSQINLVSRQDTEPRLDALIRQCEVALAALVDAEPDLLRPSLLYCDLGSGGGLPGVIWHLRLREELASLTTWLVEPREKRAWFLHRVARHCGAAPYAVAAARWGAVTAPTPETAAAALISLKALRLTDPEVLGGLAALRGGDATGPARIVIARFHPGGTAWTAELGDALGVPGPGRRIGPWTADGAGVVTLPEGDYPPAALVVSRYVSGS